ncbi:MAG TPA: type IV pilus assembly protein PilM [Acidimicrobiales bacterium]|nr:type IV pilus assembly protein PilM [Acidimicrobiales bacterium]
MQQVVGLDIGTSAVRAAELEFGAGPPKLVAFGQVGLPPEAIVDGEVKDIPVVADAIRRLWNNGRFVSDSVVVGIAGLRVITRELDLPWVPDDEVESAVRFQSEEVIPFPVDKTILSTQVLGDNTAEDGAKTRRVLVAAAHRELVDGVVAAVEQAGLNVQGVDLVSSALVRALADSAHPSTEPEAIVSVGAGLTVVVVHQEGRPQFVRTIGTGGSEATAAIAAALDLPLADAESIKLRLGDGSAQSQAAEHAVQESIQGLVGEIRSSIQYFASLQGRAPIVRVLLTGGGSLLRGFIPQLQAQVRIPVNAISPLARLDVSALDLQPEQAASIDPVLAAPIGLALPEPNASVRNFNLVPPEVLQRLFLRKVQHYAVMAAVVVGVALVGFGALNFLRVHNAQNGVNALTASVAALNAQIPTYDKVVAANEELQTSKGQVSQITVSAVDWSAVVAELSKATPTGLSLTSFTGSAQAPAVTTPTPAPATGPSSTTATTTTTTTVPTSTPAAGGGAAGTIPTGAVGSISVDVGGTFPGVAHFSPVAEWIDDITSSVMFDPPGVSAVTNAPSGSNTAVNFQSTLSLTSGATLAKNGKY